MNVSSPRSSRDTSSISTETADRPKTVDENAVLPYATDPFYFRFKALHAAVIGHIYSSYFCLAAVLALPLGADIGVRHHSERIIALLFAPLSWPMVVWDRFEFQPFGNRMQASWTWLTIAYIGVGVITFLYLRRWRKMRFSD